MTLQQPSLLMRVALVLAVVAGWTFSSRDAPMAAQTNLETTAPGAAASDGPPRALPISVEILPTSSDPATGNAIELSGMTSHFRVVVTNHSSAPIKVWDGWCSWGYSNLSFQATDSAGRRFVISKMPSGWLKNYPCPRVIDPGRPWIINVDLDPSIWQSSPVVSSESGQATLRLKAVFEIVEDEYSKRDGVWTGKVSSPEAEYTNLLAQRCRQGGPSTGFESAAAIRNETGAYFAGRHPRDIRARCDPRLRRVRGVSPVPPALSASRSESRRPGAARVTEPSRWRRSR